MELQLFKVYIVNSRKTMQKKKKPLKRNAIDMLKEEIKWIIKFSVKSEKPVKSLYVKEICRKFHFGRWFWLRQDKDAFVLREENIESLILMLNTLKYINTLSDKECLVGSTGKKPVNQVKVKLNYNKTKYWASWVTSMNIWGIFYQHF